MDIKYNKLLRLIDKNECYKKCRLSYHEMISHEDNKNLLDELPMKVDNIVLKNSSISLKIIDGFDDYFEIETKINLLNTDSVSIGNYVFIEDGSGNVVDDRFVIYPS